MARFGVIKEFREAVAPAHVASSTDGSACFHREGREGREGRKRSAPLGRGPETSSQCHDSDELLVNYMGEAMSCPRAVQKNNQGGVTARRRLRGAAQGITDRGVLRVLRGLCGEALTHPSARRRRLGAMAPPEIP